MKIKVTWNDGTFDIFEVPAALHPLPSTKHEQWFKIIDTQNQTHWINVYLTRSISVIK